jgi:hypothetical protein
MIRAAIILSLLAGTVQAETRYICWVGGSGYAMTGEFSFPDALTNDQMIRETQLTSFRIEGFLNGEGLGSWDMADVRPETRWMLRYNARLDKFWLGDTADGLYQEWNAGGDVNDCGVPGFGFNAGNYAQDVCVDNVWVEASSVDPLTRMPGFAAPRDPIACDPAAVSKRAG